MISSLNKKESLTLISSMGGTGSTSFINWFSKRLTTNCFMNSEGLPARGPGSNAKGLKHRLFPPENSDPYLPDGKKIKNALFIIDSPFNIVPSLFRRRIASGHAVAITGTRPDHKNNLESFILKGKDSFNFEGQFENWTNKEIKRPYTRMVVKFPHIWDHLSEIFAFLGLPEEDVSKFPANKTSKRKSSFENLPEIEREGLINIYKDLDQKIKDFQSLYII